MIKAKSLKRVVDSKVLFNNIELELPSNQITGLLGANGAGKTSLFRAIAGLSSIMPLLGVPRPTSGAVARVGWTMRPPVRIGSSVLLGGDPALFGQRI